MQGLLPPGLSELCQHSNARALRGERGYVGEQLALQESSDQSVEEMAELSCSDSLLRGAPTCWSGSLPHTRSKNRSAGQSGPVPELFLTAREDRLFVEDQKRVQTQNES